MLIVGCYKGRREVLNKNGLMMIKTTYIICWNCRGAVGKDFVKFSKHYNDIYKLEVFVFMETRSEPLKLQKSLEKLRFQQFIAASNTGYLGGIIVACKEEDLEVNMCSIGDQFVHARVKGKQSHEWFFTAV